MATPNPNHVKGDHRLIRRMKTVYGPKITDGEVHMANIEIDAAMRADLKAIIAPKMQRDLKAPHVDKLANEMIQGRFKPFNDALAIGAVPQRDGSFLIYLVNGQHRVHAAEVANWSGKHPVSFRSFATEDEMKSAFDIIDAGKARSDKDRNHISGRKDTLKKIKLPGESDKAYQLWESPYNAALNAIRDKFTGGVLADVEGVHNRFLRYIPALIEFRKLADVKATDPTLVKKDRGVTLPENVKKLKSFEQKIKSGSFMAPLLVMLESNPAVAKTILENMRAYILNGRRDDRISALVERILISDLGAGAKREQATRMMVESLIEIRDGKPHKRDVTDNYDLWKTFIKV